MTPSILVFYFCGGIGSNLKCIKMIFVLIFLAGYVILLGKIGGKRKMACM